MLDRKIKLGVTCFLYFNDEYLFIHRDLSKEIDPGRINGVGGKLETNENFLEAAIREVHEETGYIVNEKDIQLISVVRLEEGYKDDWVMCFFKIKVDSKEIPIGNMIEEGELIWLHKDKVLDSEYELVDDINYVFSDIISEKYTTFLNAKMDDNQKVVDTQISRLKN